MNGFALGDKVTISSKYVRSREGRERVWGEIAVPDLHGFYIGHRTVQNGFVSASHKWVSKESMPVALIVTSLSVEPFYAPYKSLTRRGM